MEKTQEFDDEIEIDLRELLAVLLSQWLLILVVTVLGGGIAFGISHYMIVPQYESTSQLLCTFQEYINYQSCGHSDRNQPYK